MSIQIVNLTNRPVTIVNPAYTFKPYENKYFKGSYTVTPELQDLDNRKILQVELMTNQLREVFYNSSSDSFETDEGPLTLSGAVIVDSASRNITTADNGMTLRPTGALTYTIPAGLTPMPSFTVDCPAAGTVSIARAGGATINGGGTTVTRTRAANPVGFVVLAHAETDAYGVSGA